jgi:hypothetical protein
MPFVPKVPDSCRDLDLAHVSRTLVKHYGYFPSTARELGVSPADLRRLTWAKPKLLDEAHEEMELAVIRGRGELIRALFSDNPRRRMWGADRMLSSWMARDSPHASATRLETRPKATIVTSFQEEPGATVTERDGKSIPVPRYDCGDDCLEGEATPQPVLLEPEPEPPSLPVRPGPHPPPPLVANLYAPYLPPPSSMIHREVPPRPRPAVLRRRLPVCRNS